MKASISAAWDQTKAIIARNSSHLAAVALAFLVLPSTVLGTVEPSSLTGIAPGDEPGSVLMLLVLLIGLTGRMTIAQIAIARGQTVGDAVRRALRRTAAAAGAFLLFMLPVAVLMAPLLLQMIAKPEAPSPGASMLLLLVGALALALAARLLSMVIPAAVAEDGGPVALLRRSWTLTRGHWWRLFGLMILFFLASGIAGMAASRVLGALLAVAAGSMEALSFSALLLSAVLAIIGAIFATLFAVMLARIYVQLAGGGVARPSVPTTGI